jgi:xanthine dehydrogenase small subunit
MEPQLVVNGRPRALGPVGGHVTLLDWLRAGGLTGVKEGCAEGECGACAVLVNRPDGADRSRWTALNACLVPAAGFDGQEVVTAEGLGTPNALHPVQYEMAVRGGSQCGYCTPGFICSMAAEYYRTDRTATAPDQEHGPNGFDLHALSGNLCRCTGYRPIRDAAYALGEPGQDDPLRARCEVVSPTVAATRVSGPQGDYVRPADLAEALDLLASCPEAQLVAGSTDWGVELNIRHSRAGLTIAVDRLDELRTLEIAEDHIHLGAALTLTEIEPGLAGRVPLLAELFGQFGSRLIRNGATLGGNLGTGSPIGDTPPALLALDASVVLASCAGEREVRLDDYFTGYRQSVRRPDELIKTIRLPSPVAPLSAFHKIAKRRFDDISSVAVAIALRLEGDVVDSVRIGLGGVAATPIRALATESALTGRVWNEATVRGAAAVLAEEGTPLSDHRASAAYRAAMLRMSLPKFYAANPGPHAEVSA